MLLETPLAVADIGFVFGCKEHSEHLARHAANLYHQGYFKQVIVSGGVDSGDRRTEAYRMRDVLVAAGVPEDVILLENRATNTGENVIFGMQLLDKKIGLANIRSVLAVGHVHGSRRYLMTLEQHWPQVIKMFSTDECGGIPRAQWQQNEPLKQAVLSEFAKVAPYKKKGFIKEISPHRMEKAIATLPQPHAAP